MHQILKKGFIFSIIYLFLFQAESAFETEHKMSKNAQRVFDYIRRHAGATDVSVIADKPNAKIFVFFGPVLIQSDSFLYGIQRHDQFPGGSMINSYYLQIPTFKKMVTPAGIFPMTLTTNDPDYGTSITFAQVLNYRLAIHRVYTKVPSQLRKQRLLSETSKDNNISAGCINVSDDFFDQVLMLLPLNSHSRLYILPNDESRLEAFFPFLND